MSRPASQNTLLWGRGESRQHIYARRLPHHIRDKPQNKELSQYIQKSSFIIQLQEYYRVMNYYINEDKGHVTKDNTTKKVDESAIEAPRHVQYTPIPAKPLNLDLTPGHQQIT